MEKRPLRQFNDDVGDLDVLIRIFKTQGLRGIQLPKHKRVRKPREEEPDLEILRRNYQADPHRE